jgi:hypothetical protein
MEHNRSNNSINVRLFDYIKLVFWYGICIINKELKLIKENEMKLTPPKAITFWIAIFLGVFGTLIALGVLNIMAATYGILILAIGFIMLALGNLLKGL